MREILGEIQDGSFAREWIAEEDAGRAGLQAKRAAEAEAHPIEETGAQAARPDELGGHEGHLSRGPVDLAGDVWSTPQ